LLKLNIFKKQQTHILHQVPLRDKELSVKLISTNPGKQRKLQMTAGLPISFKYWKA